MLLRHTAAEGARVVADRICEAIAVEPWSHRPVTVSIGAATLDRPLPDGGTLLSEADRALYEAKRRGRNCVVSAGEMAAHEHHGQHKQSA
ncbi:MAG: diguanylate cyclase domain-containing protein [Gemmatimonadaceae bacterium]